MFPLLCCYCCCCDNARSQVGESLLTLFVFALAFAIASQLLAQLDGSARNSPSAALSVNANARLTAIQEEDEEDDQALHHSSLSARGEAKRLEQAYLNSKCARLVLSCIRHRYNHLSLLSEYGTVQR